jgi:hypothetical protein
MGARNRKIHALSLVSANEEKKAGCYALQSDRLREHQDERGYGVLDSILIKHRFEPVTQKMKNEVEIECDKDAVDDQLDDKIRKGTFSGIFHDSGWDRLGFAAPSMHNWLQMVVEEFCGSLLHLLPQDRIEQHMS